MPDVDKVKGNYVENNRAREEESDMRGGKKAFSGATLLPSAITIPGILKNVCERKT